MLLHNTFSRRKEELPKDNREFKIYVCGLTAYDRPHLGHARSAIVFDVLHRFMEWQGMRVYRVQNFTDVDDKIIERSEKAGENISVFAEKYARAFLQGMDALNVKRADLYPRATKEMPHILQFIEILVNKCAAYQSNGNVYFRVSAYPDYGKLSRRSIPEMLKGVRIELDEGKEHPADFVLWKAAKQNEPYWDSPWGPGRPGWHIECSAMALHHLGKRIDIHGGGIDLLFPHHENEIAQSETALDLHPFSYFWVHNGLVQLADGEKMSKSIGNSAYVEDILEKYDPDAVRLWLLQSHYRAPITLQNDSIGNVLPALYSLRDSLKARSGYGEALDPTSFRERFTKAMEYDLGTPRALSILFDLRRNINQCAKAGRSVKDAQVTMRELAGVLGLTLEESKGEENHLSNEYIESIIYKRDNARRENRFAEADSLRDELARKGVLLHDSPQGTTWSKIR